MKHNRKFGALLTALTLAVSTMGGVTAFAEETVVPSQKGENVQFIKSVTAPEGVTIPAKTFNFTAEQMTTTDGENFTVNDTESPMYNKTVKQGEKIASSIKGSTSVTETVSKAEGNLYQGSMDLSSLKTPGVYVFKVSEDAIEDAATEENYGWRNTGKEEYLMRVYVKKTQKGLSYETTFVAAETNENETTAKGDKLSGPTVVENTITEKGGIIFTNNFTKRSGEDGGTEINGKKNSLIVQKNINDPSGFANHENDKFTFKVKFTNVGVNSAVNKDFYEGTVYTVSENNTYTKKDSEKKVTFTAGTEKEVQLLGSEALVFEDIPAGTKVTVGEETVTVNNCALDKAETKIIINGEDITLEEGQKVSDKMLGEKENSAKFVNKYEKIDITGLALRYMPFVLIGLVAVAGALVYNKAKKLHR